MSVNMRAFTCECERASQDIRLREYVCAHGFEWRRQYRALNEYTRACARAQARCVTSAQAFTSMRVTCVDVQCAHLRERANARTL
eukprot:6200714-Pleurochrysis_carterae.AAC.1